MKLNTWMCCRFCNGVYSINNNGRMRVHTKISSSHKFKVKRCNGSLQLRHNCYGIYMETKKKEQGA